MSNLFKEIKYPNKPASRYTSLNAQFSKLIDKAKCNEVSYRILMLGLKCFHQFGNFNGVDADLLTRLNNSDRIESASENSTIVTMSSSLSAEFSEVTASENEELELSVENNILDDGATSENYNFTTAVDIDGALSPENVVPNAEINITVSINNDIVPRPIESIMPDIVDLVLPLPPEKNCPRRRPRSDSQNNSRLCYNQNKTSKRKRKKNSRYTSDQNTNIC